MPKAVLIFNSYGQLRQGAIDRDPTRSTFPCQFDSHCHEPWQVSGELALVSWKRAFAGLLASNSYVQSRLQTFVHLPCTVYGCSYLVPLIIALVVPPLRHTIDHSLPYTRSAGKWKWSEVVLCLKGVLADHVTTNPNGCWLKLLLDKDLFSSYTNIPSPYLLMTSHHETQHQTQGTQAKTFWTPKTLLKAFLMQDAMPAVSNLISNARQRWTKASIFENCSKLKYLRLVKHSAPISMGGQAASGMSVAYLHGKDFCLVDYCVCRHGLQEWRA